MAISDSVRFDLRLQGFSNAEIDAFEASGLSDADLIGTTISPPNQPTADQLSSFRRPPDDQISFGFGNVLNDQRPTNQIIKADDSLNRFVLSSIKQIEQAIGRNLSSTEFGLISQRINAETSVGTPPNLIGQIITSEFLPGLIAVDQRRTARDQQSQFDRLLNTEQATQERNQAVINSFLGAGGVADAQSIAQLASARGSEDAIRLAQESLARQQSQEAARQSQFESERGQLADFTRGEQLKALEQARPFIREQLQRQGISLDSGALADVFANKAADLELSRQNFLGGLTREDFLQGRNLNQIFSDQARQLALSQQSLPQGRLEQLFNTRAGTTREDLLGSRNVGNQVTSNTIQNNAASLESARQRQFQQNLFNQQLQLANALAAEERKGSRLGSLFGLGGSAIGAGIGGFGGGGLQGALIGAGLGSSIGGGLSGLFGGTPQQGQSSPFFNALDFLSLLPKRSRTTSNQTGTAGVNGLFSLS